MRNRPYVLTVLGYAAYTFAVGGLAFWMPAFLERVRGIPHADAAIDFGKIVVITGFVGHFRRRLAGRLLREIFTTSLYVAICALDHHCGPLRVDGAHHDVAQLFA